MTPTTTEGTTATTASAAKEQAGEVAGSAAAAAGDVAGTAKEQAGNVLSEAVTQTQELLGHAGQQVNAQAAEQTQRLTGNIRRLAAQLADMARAGEQGSTAHSLVLSVADQADRAAAYLEGKQPGELVADLQELGRRRPGTFLIGAAVAGVAVGRLAGAAKRATAPPSSGLPAQPLSSTPTTEPSAPLRDVAPGAATIEPYPAATGDAR